MRNLTLLGDYKNILLVFALLFLFVKPILAQHFTLISGKTPLPMYVSAGESPVVKTAVSLFENDVQRVFDNTLSSSIHIGSSKIILCTVGVNLELDNWIEKQGVDTRSVQGAWEAFRLQTICVGREYCLVILGSDARGTAYGLLELSRLIGVSPWNWWADATPLKKDNFQLPINYNNQQQPSVKYRGIFLNDEDWGLAPWSARHYEQSAVKNEIGLKTYTRIFELLLRLRANMLWPAMHKCSTPFYHVEGTKEVAAQYGIVMGTSHCEPLMRNNVGEWDKTKYKDYNYLTNKKNIQRYWGERLQDVSAYENIYTIGMRGVHDGKMNGVETLDDQTALLTEVIKDQRDLLSRYIHSDATKVPQVIMPYKEVQDIYDNGLAVPDDVTLVWCDDNYGYIPRLSTAKEQERSGGAGVYYHISYFGRPHDYLWLYSTPPALIHTEMKRAWDHGARNLWVVNVGDIKPSEYGVEFFLDLAWNINMVGEKGVSDHLGHWLQREFNEDVANVLLPIMNEYFRLATVRRPEFMGWNRVEEYALSKRKGGITPLQDSEFNPMQFGNELQRRIDQYDQIAQNAVKYATLISPQQKDAYFELIQYPICAAAAMNRKILYAQEARFFAKQNLLIANEYAAMSQNAYNEIAALTVTYNKIVSQGKWDGMVDMMPRQLPVFDAPNLPAKVVGNSSYATEVWLEGVGQKTILLPIYNKTICTRTISLYNRRKEPIKWEVMKKPSWLIVKEKESEFRYKKELIVGVDWTKITESKTDQMTIAINDKEYQITVSAHKFGKDEGDKVEIDGMVAWNAADGKGVATNQIIPQLGHSSQSVKLNKGKTLRYEINTTSVGKAILRVGAIPNHPVEGGDMRYAISIDGEKPQIVSLKVVIRDENWKSNVLRNQSLTHTTHVLDTPGKHLIEIKALDNHLLLDQFMLDFDLERKFYQIPTLY